MTGFSFKHNKGLRTFFCFTHSRTFQWDFSVVLVIGVLTREGKEMKRGTHASRTHLPEVFALPTSVYSGVAGRPSVTERQMNILVIS